MPLKVLAKPSSEKQSSAKAAPDPYKGLKRSTLDVFDIPIEDLIESPDNPNEMDEATFDQFVEGMKADGFDEPIHVIPIIDGEHEGKWMIFSGHHRKKAAAILGYAAVPAIIKAGWDDDKRLIELVRRNKLRGNLSAEKFTNLYNKLAPRGYDEAMLKLQLGFVHSKEFDKVFQGARRALTPTQRKKLDDAKEKIKSVDDLSSVLHDIMANHGSELKSNMVVFSYGKGKNKKVYYIQADAELSKRLDDLQAEINDKGADATQVFKELVSAAKVGTISASTPKPKLAIKAKPK